MSESLVPTKASDFLLAQSSPQLDTSNEIAMWWLWGPTSECLFVASSSSKLCSPWKYSLQLAGATTVVCKRNRARERSRKERGEARASAVLTHQDKKKQESRPHGKPLEMPHAMQRVVELVVGVAALLGVAGSPSRRVHPVPEVLTATNLEGKGFSKPEWQL